MRLVLPFPPSANLYWRSLGRGRVVLSKEGREYKEQCDLVARMHKVDCIQEGEVMVRATIYFPNRRGDLDNRIKPLLDAIQKVCYRNDSQVSHISVSREIDKGDPRVEIEISEAAA